LGLVGLLPWTPLLPLALVPLAERPRPAAVVLAAAWVTTGVAFFSLAAAKRSVYLLPLHPAVALLLGAGVATRGSDGRLARAARLGAYLYAPAALLLAGLAGALALGADPLALARPWLRPDDAAGAATLAGAARACSSGRTNGSACATRTGRRSPCSRGARRGRPDTAAWCWSRRRSARSSPPRRAPGHPRRSRSERVVDPGEDRVPLRAAAD